METQERKPDAFEPVPPTVERSVEVLATTMRIHDLSIEKPAILAYLQNVAPDKYEIALVHALEVGVKEIMARRERPRPATA